METEPAVPGERHAPETPEQPGRAVAREMVCGGEEFAGSAQVIVVAGVMGNIGTSGVVAAVAGAALAGGLSVRVIDAACPRRAGLRELCTTEGCADDVGAGRSVVSSAADRLQVQHVAGGMDARVDDPPRWERGAGPADVVLVDVGASVEDVMTGSSAGAWLDPGQVGAGAWMVLAVQETSHCLRRTEAVLGQWSAAGLLPLAQVVSTGPGPAPATVRGQVGHYTGLALDRSVRQAWHPQVYGYSYTQATLSGPMLPLGRAILAAMGGPAARAVPQAPGNSRRRLTRWRKTS